MTKEEAVGKLKDLMYEIELETIRSEYKIRTIKSLDAFHKQNGYLTVPQQDLLANIYTEVIG